MVGKKKKNTTPSQRGLPIQEVSTPSSPSRRSPRRTNSLQSGNEWNFGNINVSPNDQSRDSQADHEVASDLVRPGGLGAEDNEDVEVQLAQPDFDSSDPYSVLGVPEQASFLQIKKTYFKLSKQYHPDRLTSLPNQQDAHTTFTAIANAYEVLKDPEKRREYDLLRSLHTDISNDVFNVDVEDSGSEEEQSPLSASKPPPVNDPEDKLHSSSASNSKTSMDDSSGHPNDAGKKAAATSSSSSSDASSSSDDSSDDSSNDGEDCAARSAQTIGRGKDVAFRIRFAQGKQPHLGSPSADESSEDVSNDHNEGAHSATTTGRGKVLPGKKLHRVLPTAKNRSANAQCVYFDVFSTYARHQPPGAKDFNEIKAAIKSVTTNLTSQRSRSKNRMSQLHSEVSSWNTKRQMFPCSSTIFNESIGEDGLSSQSTYDVRIDNPHHIEAIAPNPKVLIDSQPTNDLTKNYYEILAKAMNDMRIQASSNDTLSAIDRTGRTFNTHIAEMHAARVCLNIDDVEFYEWALENKFARLWYCHDLQKSEILKLAIENAINRSPHDLVQRCLFQNEKDKQRNQFVGFVSSHTTGKIVDSFHLHSFVVFHTINGQDTIVTCIVTARNHILSNMQDRVLQLMQLIQYDL